MEKVFEGPLHTTAPLVKRGVTIIVATTGAVPELTAVKEAIFPEPAAESPIAGALLVQL